MGTQEHFYMEGKHMNRALCQLFISIFSPGIQRTFKEELMANPNTKLKQIYKHLLDISRRVTQKEVKDINDRLTTAWKPHQRFEVLVA
jgi:hypothetical protein